MESKLEEGKIEMRENWEMMQCFEGSGLGLCIRCFKRNGFVTESLSNAETVRGNGSRTHYDCRYRDNYLKQPSDQGRDVPLIFRGMRPRALWAYNKYPNGAMQIK